MGDVKFDDSGYKFDDLEQKYKNFMAPAFEVLVDGANLVRESMAITTVKVDTTVDDRADSFSFDVTNAYDAVKREFRWAEKYFVPGKYVEIKMGYTDKLETVFYGLITSVNFDYPRDGNPKLTVKGMDISFLMMKGKLSNTWNDKKHSEVAKMVGSKYLSKLQIDETKEKLAVIDQHDMNDYHFLNWMAGQNNFDFFVVGKTMYFRKPLKSKTPVVNLMYGKNLLSFSTDVNIAKQVSQVIVRGVDELKKEKDIEGKSKEVNILGSNSKTGKDIMKVFGDNTKEYVYANVKSKAEADEMADALMNKKAMELINGNGESIGLPEIRAGKYIKLDGLGPKLAQPLYIKSAVHTINRSGYITSFTVGGNAI